MFRKKNKEPEYTFYEADDFYADEHMNEYAPRKKKKGRGNKNGEADSYYNESYEEYEKNAKTNRSTKIIIVIAVYAIFVIIGVFSTSFMTNEVGKREAQIIDVRLREERENYYTLKAQYFAIKDLLVMVQETDNKLAKSADENTFVYSTEYQNILSNLDKQGYLPTAKSMVVSDKYSTLKKQTVTIYDDLSYYLQKMSAALSNRDNEQLNQALSWRKKTFDDFENFRSNMREFSKLIKIEEAEFENTQPIFSTKTTVPQGGASSTSPSAPNK